MNFHFDSPANLTLQQIKVTIRLISLKKIEVNVCWAVEQISGGFCSLF